MYMYFLAGLLAAFAMPVSVIAMSMEDEIEAQEHVMEFNDDEDNAMNTPDYDPNIDSGDIDEDDSDIQD